MTESSLLNNKQFDFQKGHFTDHAIIQFAVQINEMFNKNIYAPGVLVNLSNAFDHVNHKILLKNPSSYGAKIKAWIGLLVIFLKGNRLQVTRLSG